MSSKCKQRNMNHAMLIEPVDHKLGEIVEHATGNRAHTDVHVLAHTQSACLGTGPSSGWQILRRICWFWPSRATQHRLLGALLGPHNNTVPAMVVRLTPPTQILSPSSSICTRPARPSAVPWATT